MSVPISVVMAVYNDHAFVAGAIKSIRNQTFRDFEFIVIDDGSTDGSFEAIQDAVQGDSRMRIIQQNNRGLTVSLNRAISEARGAYIARMDADDVADPERLRVQYAFLEAHPDIALVGSQAWYINEVGERIGEKRLPVQDQDIRHRLLFNNQFVHTSLFIRASVLDELGAYDPVFAKSQDYELVLRVARAHKVANIDQPLVSWRVASGSASWTGKRQEWDSIRARWLAITRYGYNPFLGLFHIVLRLGWLVVPQRIKIKRYAH